MCELWKHILQHGFCYSRTMFYDILRQSWLDEYCPLCQRRHSRSKTCHKNQSQQCQLTTHYCQHAKPKPKRHLNLSFHTTLSHSAHPIRWVLFTIVICRKSFQRNNNDIQVFTTKVTRAEIDSPRSYITSSHEKIFLAHFRQKLKYFFWI